MNNATISKLSGEIVSIGKDMDIMSHTYWIDITIRLPYGHIVNTIYTFYRESIQKNLLSTLKNGMSITVSVDGEVNLDRKLDYKGVGAIKINDHALQLNEYIDDELKQSQADYFSEPEIVLIHNLLELAKTKIKEDYDPSVEEMAKVENHIDSLAKKTKGLTKIDWKRMFISCLIDISIDIGFGSTIPEALYNLFKNIAKEVLRGRLIDKPSNV
jgi:uncharacterized alkaline shock family protein YloU